MRQIFKKKTDRPIKIKIRISIVIASLVCTIVLLVGCIRDQTSKTKENNENYPKYESEDVGIDAEVQYSKISNKYIMMDRIDGVFVELNSNDSDNLINYNFYENSEGKMKSLEPAKIDKMIDYNGKSGHLYFQYVIYKDDIYLKDISTYLLDEEVDFEVIVSPLENNNNEVLLELIYERQDDAHSYFLMMNLATQEVTDFLKPLKINDLGELDNYRFYDGINYGTFRLKPDNNAEEGEFFYFNINDKSLINLTKDTEYPMAWPSFIDDHTLFSIVRSGDEENEWQQDGIIYDITTKRIKVLYQNELLDKYFNNELEHYISHTHLGLYFLEVEDRNIYTVSKLTNKKTLIEGVTADEKIDVSINELGTKLLFIYRSNDSESDLSYFAIYDIEQNRLVRMQRKDSNEWEELISSWYDESKVLVTAVSGDYNYYSIYDIK